MVDDITSDMDRRKLLGSVAIAGGALPLLAACGDDEGPTAQDQNQQDDGGGDRDESTTIEASEVPVGSGAIFEDEAIVVTQPQEGQFKAFSAICTHNDCVVSEITEEGILCHCHDSEYDLNTGEVVGGPAPRPLPEKSVQDDNGTLTIS